MGSVVDSLKRLYKKIGGGKVKGPIAIDDLVDKIADQMSSGESSGSNNVLNVELTYILDTLTNEPSGVSLNKTYGELLNALKNEKIVVISAVIVKDSNGNVLSKNENIYSLVVGVTIDYVPETNKYNTEVSNSYNMIENQYSSVEEALVSYPGTPPRQDTEES